MQEKLNTPNHPLNKGVVPMSLRVEDDITFFLLKTFKTVIKKIIYHYIYKKLKTT